MDADRGPGRSGIDRAVDAAALGLGARLPAGAPADLERAARDDPDARVRAAALGALSRVAEHGRATTVWRAALTDPSPAVRRRAADLAPGLDAPAPPLLPLLADGDVTVIEAAAWALGELGSAAVDAGGVPALSTVAREAAVAALGALGDPAGLPAVLDACHDKPAVRRRAVLALAPFDGHAVDAALHAARSDRDWQVRQAAEDLLDE
jgi:HEAT repeat protein